MNLVIKRDFYRTDGIYSTCFDENGDIVMVTLDHAYGDNPTPKVPPGEYTCKRGIHTHKDGTKYETFEVEGVSGHDNILFHVGNYGHDTEGCFLCGDIVLHSKTDDWMLTGSRKAGLS
jgi:hypothetical protein